MAPFAWEGKSLSRNLSEELRNSMDYDGTEPGNFSSRNLSGDYNTTDTIFYYSYRYRVVGTFFNSIIFVVGVLGNLMVVAVVKRTRYMLTPTNCYLVSLAIADTVVLMATVPNEILSYHVAINQWLTGYVGCILHVFSYNIGINASSLSLVAFTVERYVAICHPMKAHTGCTIRRAKKVILAVWIFTVCYCSPWLFLTGITPLHYRLHPEAGQCNFLLPREEYLYIYLADMFLFYVVPLTVSCFLYFCIARVLLSRDFSASQSRSKGIVHLEIRSGSSARNQVVKMLAMVVAVFAALWLPYRGMLVYNSFASLFGRVTFMDLWYLMFAKSCIYINCAINPILYNAMSFKFRRAFRRALCCKINSCCLRPPATSSKSFKRKKSLNSLSTTTKTTFC